MCIKVNALVGMYIDGEQMELNSQAASFSTRASEAISRWSGHSKKKSPNLLEYKC